ADEVKAVAYTALSQVVRPDDLDNLLDLMATADDRYIAHVQEAVVAAVNRSTDRDVQTQQVIARFDRADITAQPHFFPILAGIGGKTALALVADYTGQDNPALRRAATSALA